MSERVGQSHLSLLNFSGGSAARNVLFTLWEDRNSLLRSGCDLSHPSAQRQFLTVSCWGKNAEVRARSSLGSKKRKKFCNSIFHLAENPVNI